MEIDVLETIKLQSLSVEDTGILFKLINEAWSSASQYQLPSDYNVLSKLISVEQEKIESLISRLSACSRPIFVDIINIDGDCEIIIVCQFLLKQITRHRKWLSEQAMLLRKKEMSIRKGSLKHRIATEKSQESSYGYLEPEKRLSRCFCGWLPTNRFETQGQVFYITSSIRSEIEKAYPDVDVEHVMSDIFNWLISQPHRRKTLASMSFFIFSWLERTTIHSQFDREIGVNSSFDDIEKELDEILGLSK